MANHTLDIYLDDVNKYYLEKLSFLTMYKSRGLGLGNAADLFCEAYKNYNDKLSEEYLHTLKTTLVSHHIIENYGIEYKTDLLYLFRHPALLPRSSDSKQKKVRKKVLQFSDTVDPYIKDAYDFLKEQRPVKRAELIDKIIEQYLLVTENSYYISQAALRLMECIIQNVNFDENGQAVGHEGMLIDAIWDIGSSKKRTN